VRFELLIQRGMATEFRLSCHLG